MITACNFLLGEPYLQKVKWLSKPKVNLYYDQAGQQNKLELLFSSQKYVLISTLLCSAGREEKTWYFWVWSSMQLIPFTLI